MTSVTIRDQYGEYTIECFKNDMDISEMMEYCIVPALKASGYSDNIIKTVVSGVEV